MSKRDHVADPSAKQNRISSHKCLSPSRKYQYGTRSNGAEPHHLYNHRVQDRHYTSIPFMQSEESSHSNISTEPEMKEPHRNFECCFPTKPRSTSASGEGPHKNGSSQNAQYPNAKLVTAERHLLNLHMEHIATRLSLRRKITAKSRMLAVCKRNWKRKKEKQDKGKKRKEKKERRNAHWSRRALSRLKCQFPSRHCYANAKKLQLVGGCLENWEVGAFFFPFEDWMDVLLKGGNMSHCPGVLR
jgi:hypothetical protein